MSLHFSNGQVLLKNVTDDNWYYLAVSVDAQDGLPHLAPSQESLGDLTLEEFSEYVILRCADNGVLYKLALATNEAGDIDFSFVAADVPVSQIPIRLYLKDQSTGLLYEVTASMDPFTGEVYPAVTAYSAAANTRTINKHQRCMTPVNTVEPACVVPADATDEGDIIVGPSTAVPRSPILIGEGGGAIGGEGGGGMIGE